MGIDIHSHTPYNTCQEYKNIVASHVVKYIEDP